MRIVERDASLAALGDAWSAASRGAGQLVLLEGEAGFGKTATLRAFVRDLGGPDDPKGPDSAVLWGGCEPIEPPRPLGPLHDWARVAGGHLGALMASVHSRHESFDAALELLAGAPRVAIIEDLHWADDATLDLLVFLARRVADCPSLVVASLRSEALESSPRLRRTVGRLVSLGVHQETLGSLSPSAVSLLVEGTGLDPEDVHRTTGGHPFFVSELVASGATGDVPTTVRDVILGRVAELGPGARALLEAAAVVPDRVELEVVTGAADSEPSALEECERARLLISDGRTVRFRHELARIAVEQSLSGARRRRLHQAVVAALALRPGPNAARLSHHADLAGDAVAVLRFAPVAAAEASRVGAHREAAGHLLRAVAHVDLLALDDGARLLAASATEHGHIAALDTAIEHSWRAVTTWRQLDDLDELAAQLGHHALLLWADARPTAARRIATEAVAVGTERPGSRGLATALAMDAYLRMLARDADAAVAVGARAAELARGLGETSLLARALNAVGSAHFTAGRVEEGSALLAESLAVAEAAGDDERTGAAMVNLGSSAGECRQYAMARTWLRRCHEWCDRRELVGNRDYALAWLARVAFETGDWAEATRIAEVVSESETVIARIVAGTVRARIAVRRDEPEAGDLVRAAGALAAQTNDLQRTWPVAAARAEAAWLAGRSDEIHDLVEADFRRGVGLRHPWSVGELGYWLAVAGALDEAGRQAVAEIAPSPYAAQVAGDGTAAVAAWDAVGCPYEAALARSETLDVAELREAVRTLDRLDARPLADRVAQRLRALGGSRPPRPRATTRARPSGLTEREQEIALLVASGLTNAEIAGRLHISTKTAGHHVSAILAKLQLGSRREVAGAVRAWGAPERT